MGIERIIRLTRLLATMPKSEIELTDLPALLQDSRWTFISMISPSRIPAARSAPTSGSEASDLAK